MANAVDSLSDIELELLKQLETDTLRLDALTSAQITREVLVASLDRQSLWVGNNLPELMSIVNHRLLDPNIVENKFLEVVSLSFSGERNVGLYLLRSKYATKAMFDVTHLFGMRGDGGSLFGKKLIDIMLPSPKCSREVALKYINLLRFRKIALNNPNLTASYLRSWCDANPTQVTHVITNPNCPKDIITSYLRKKYKTPSKLIDIANSANALSAYSLEWNLLQSKNFPIDFLLDSKTNNQTFVETLLMLPSYPIDCLRKKAHQFKNYVVRNPSCPHDLLLELATSWPKLSEQAMLDLVKTPMLALSHYWLGLLRIRRVACGPSSTLMPQNSLSTYVNQKLCKTTLI